MQHIPGSAATGAPFRSGIAPDEAVPHPGWQRARTAVLDALARGEAAALLGPPGSGKTLLLQDLARALRHEGRAVRLVERGDAFDPAAGAGTALVDEAERMGADGLARLCATGVPFVLAALPGFADRLAGLPRPVVPVALEPLSPEGIARFVAARLVAAGRARDMLDPDAVLALARHSGGLPRLVNTLAGAAVFLAEMEGLPRVRRRHVDEAASMRDGLEHDAVPARPVEPPAEPAGPAGGAPPAASSVVRPVVALRAEAPLAPRVHPPARRRRAAVGAAAAGLAFVLAAGWAASGWWVARPPGIRPDERTRDAAGPRDGAGERPSAAPDERTRATEAAGGGSGDPRRQAERPPYQADADANPRPEAGTSPFRRPVELDAPLSFRGPVYNETLNRGGQMSLVIKGRGPAGAITARFEAWGGLLGSGELAGTLSEDGRVSLSGRLMVGRNPFDCDLSGSIVGDRLTGAATFVRSGGGGRGARSSFTLTKF